MRKPGKRWVWRDAFRNATGGAASGAAGGAMAGMLDPTGATALAGAAVGAVTGFVGSIVTDGVGFIWDDEPSMTFASVPLFNFVLGLFLNASYTLTALPLQSTGVDSLTFIGVIAFVTSAIASGTARLIDDIRARRQMRPDSSMYR